MNLLKIILASLFFASSAFAQWQKFDVGTKASFRGLDVVSEKVVWASGTGGTVIRTIDGGKTWDVIKVKGAEKLDFRDIEAFDQNTAYILSIGTGDSSRIYKTTDGGESWKLQFKNSDKTAFFDSIAFWDEKHGIAQSDPVDGKYVFYATNDGETWKQLPPRKMPSAKVGEAAFAASGTSIVTYEKKRVWLVTGGSDARVFRSKNRGRTWRVAETPIVNGTPGSGIFGIAMRDKKQGVIVGGNYEKPDEITSNLAFTKDGGKTWRAAKGLNGYRSGIAYLRQDRLVAVGSSGSEISHDGGATWEKLDDNSYNAVGSIGKPDNHGGKNFDVIGYMTSTWAVGPKGLVAHLTFWDITSRMAIKTQ